MNIQVLVLFLVYVAILVSLGLLRPGTDRARYLIRKSIHTLTGLAIFYLSFHISRENMLFLLVVGTFFSFLTFYMPRVNYIHVTSPSSLGTLFYPLGILLSFLVLWKEPPELFRAAVLILAVSDTVANLGGYLVRGNPRFAIFSEEKSLLGILGFALSAYLILKGLLPEPWSGRVPWLLLAVILGIHFEILSHRGSDNLTVPLGIALFLAFSRSGGIPALWILGVIAVLAPSCLLLVRTGVLTRYGSLTAYLLGLLLFGFMGWRWGLTLVFFFITSVALTRLNSTVNRKSTGSGHRNAWQVMANSAVAVAAALLFGLTGTNLFIFLFISAVSAVTADTWASEIGPVFQKRCFSLAGWSGGPAGVSGGISITGSLGALAGALATAITGTWLLLPVPGFRTAAILALSGFLASFIDSILGAFLEPRLDRMAFFSGKHGMERITPNDIVNLVASLTAPLIFLLLKGWI